MAYPYNPRKTMIDIVKRAIENDQLFEFFVALAICLLPLALLIYAALYFDRRRRKNFKLPPPPVDPFAPQKEEPAPSALSLQTEGEPLHLNNPFRGILCIGSAGSGKSESVLRQLVSSAVKNDFCGVIYDFKFPTLTNELQGYLIENKALYGHFSVNFHDLERTHRVNPLHPDYIKSASHAREYSTAIINNLLPESLEKKDFWTRSCTDILAAVIFYLAKEQPHYSTLPHAVALILTDETKLIKMLSTNLQSLGMVKSLETAVRNNSTEQLSGVISTLQSAISVLNTPEIFYVLSGNDFSLHVNDPANPIWLSLGNCAETHETFSPVLSLIATVALKQMNQAGGHQSIVLLDEAPTLYIPKLEVIPATARSNRISLALFAQDTSQIVAQYGQKNADVIMSLLNNQLFGRVSSQKTAEYISKLFGKDDKYFSSYSHNQGSSSSLMSSSKSKGSGSSRGVQERDRVKPQELLGLEVGNFYGVLVEGKSKEFKARLSLIGSEPRELEARFLPFDIEDNFKLIHGQIGLL